MQYNCTRFFADFNTCAVHSNAEASERRIITLLTELENLLEVCNTVYSIALS